MHTYAETKHTGLNAQHRDNLHNVVGRGVARVHKWLRHDPHEIYAVGLELPLRLLDNLALGVDRRPLLLVAHVHALDARNALHGVIGFSVPCSQRISFYRTTGAVASKRPMILGTER